MPKAVHQPFAKKSTESNLFVGHEEIQTLQKYKDNISEIAQQRRTNPMDRKRLVAEANRVGFFLLQHKY